MLHIIFNLLYIQIYSILKNENKNRNNDENPVSVCLDIPAIQIDAPKRDSNAILWFWKEEK